MAEVLLQIDGISKSFPGVKANDEVSFQINSGEIHALLGENGAGKSTLVNRIIGKREAIVEERPGVTRDRNEFDVIWAGCEFTLIDTGGWLPKSKSEKGIDDKVSKQSELAIKQADVTILVVDARVSPTVEDALIAEMLRGREKPTFLAANKVDDQNHEVGMWEYLSMGLGEPQSSLSTPWARNS